MEKVNSIGFILNPIAGMGGKTALKGTDGAAVLAEARARGAVPESPLKAGRALKKLAPLGSSVQVLTASGPMGADLCRELGLEVQEVYACPDGATTAEDTKAAAEAIAALHPQLLLFAGGDGTARNICEAVGETLPVLGIPAGVKIQSAVFALNPEDAGTIAARMASGTPMRVSSREVVDLDEDEYRTGHVHAKLYGSLSVPFEPALVQDVKQSGFDSEEGSLEGIASYLEAHMQPGVTYAIGSGSTAKCICRRLGLDYELLGVDIIRDGKLLDRDVTEEKLWQYAKEGGLRAIVSPIGGQGFLFGRGNHQFSARVLDAITKPHIFVVSPESKLLSIRDHTLHVDCGSEESCRRLQGYYNVLCGWGYFHSLKCR